MTSNQTKKKLTVLIDNYDSFTYNIFQIFSRLIENDRDEEIRVYRNDAISIQELEKMNPYRIIISPGPGTPSESGISVPVIRKFANKVPILGVCLGHQALGEAFGAHIVQARKIVHGKVEPMENDGCGVFRNLPNPCSFTRYHSLAVDPSTVPEELEVTARSEDGEIMGLRHRELPLEGVQFHPESIGSEHGERLLANFLNWRREPLNKTMLLNKIITREDLEEQEAASFMDDLTDGSLEDVYVAGILTALSTKGISASELAGCVSVLIKKKQHVQTEIPILLDTCGTGGDGKHTFNISSFSALIASSCGVAVAKHGNRSVSSKSGSTDFFAALGIDTNLDASGVTKSLQEEGFAYMAAPNFHGAMRHVAPVRKILGIKTIMNCLGPLANPAGANCQIIGVYDPALIPVMAKAAKLLGAKRIMCLHSRDGLDEISPAAPTEILMIDESDKQKHFIFDPAEAGIKNIRTEELTGGDALQNARIARELLRGKGPAAIKEAVLLNAGASLYIAGLANNIPEGYNKAKTALEDGTVQKKVEALCKRSENRVQK